MTTSTERENLARLIYDALCEGHDNTRPFPPDGKVYIDDTVNLLAIADYLIYCQGYEMTWNTTKWSSKPASSPTHQPNPTPSTPSSTGNSPNHPQQNTKANYSNNGDELSTGIERIVGMPRHRWMHIGRAISSEETVYILHSKQCKDNGIDLRDCQFSLALDRGINLPSWTGYEDKPVGLGIIGDRLVPLAGWSPRESR